MKPDTGRQREVQVLLVWVAGSRFGAPSPAQAETVAGKDSPAVLRARLRTGSPQLSFPISQNFLIEQQVPCS